MRCIRVLCVDDNEWIGTSIAQLVRAQRGWEWLGWRSSTAGLVSEAAGLGEAMILFDVDLPGGDSFEVVAQLRDQCPEIRVVMLSGHLSPELVDRAMDAGAWGYISKTDDTAVLMNALTRVAAGEVVFSPSILEEFGRVT